MCDLLGQAHLEVFDNVLEIRGGKGKRKDERKEELTGEYQIPYYDSNGIIGYTKEYLYNGVNIVTARKLSIGSVHYVEGKYHPSDDTINMTSKNETILFNKYFYYWLLFNNDILKRMSTGIKPGIRMSDVRQLKIPIPPLEIQQQIVVVLTQIDSKIKAESEYIEKMRQITPKVFSYYFNQGSPDTILPTTPPTTETSTLSSITPEISSPPLPMTSPILTDLPKVKISIKLKPKT